MPSRVIFPWDSYFGEMEVVRYNMHQKSYTAYGRSGQRQDEEDRISWWNRTGINIDVI